MDHQTRILPHLNSYFLQRKAYENHRKKIQSIRNSITKPSSKIVENNQQQNEENTQNREGKSNVKYSFHTIKEQIKNELNGRISPWAKRQRYQAEIENVRLQNRLKKCSSTINRKEMQKHRMKNEEIKQRISKFLYNANSHKTLLKCKHSLEILRQKQRLKQGERSSFNESRVPSRMKHSRSQITHMERYRSSQRLKTQNPSQKNNIEKFYLVKNRNKIRSHFDKKHDLLFQSRKSNISDIRRQAITQNRMKYLTQVQV